MILLNLVFTGKDFLNFFFEGERRFNDLHNEKQILNYEKPHVDHTYK